MRSVDLIVVHCSATPNGVRHTVHDIDLAHRDRGYVRGLDWREKCNPDVMACGYHFVIRPNGALDTGRHLDEVGAHARGYNATSVGVCLIGTDRFTPDQWKQLRLTTRALTAKYPTARVLGHRDLNPNSPRPGFDVAAWMAGGMEPLVGHILEAP